MVLRIKINPNDSSQARAIIQMQENIGRVQETNLFLVEINSLTAAGAFPRLVNGVNLGANYLPVSQWAIEQNQLYFMLISKQSTGYFLTSIDYIDRWVEEKGLNEYLASGRLPLDYAESQLLSEELQKHNQEMARVLAEMDPDISDEEYFTIMAPLEKREKELQDKSLEVWGRMRCVPHIHPIFRSAESEGALSAE